MTRWKGSLISDVFGGHEPTTQETKWTLSFEDLMDGGQATATLVGQQQASHPFYHSL